MARKKDSQDILKDILSGRRRVRRKCKFCKNNIKEIDYKNVDILKKYTTEKGKIMPSRTTGTCAKHQRQLTAAIKRARFIALMPYVSR